MEQHHKQNYFKKKKQAPKPNKQQQHKGQEGNAWHSNNNMVSRLMKSSACLSLASPSGPVCLPWLLAPPHNLQGCGLVVFSTREEAAAAMEVLHGKFVWPGARSAMIIERMDPHKQHKKRRAQPLTHHLAGARQHAPGAALTPRAVTALAGGGPLARTNSNSSASATIEADWLELLA